MRRILFAERDLIPTFATFLACLFAGVELGILIGTIIDLAILIYLNARPTMYIEYRNVSGHKGSELHLRNWRCSEALKRSWRNSIKDLFLFRRPRRRIMF
jgi:MFS superfamily sulfate permease-like transporter